MSENLDAADRKLLRELQRDAARSAAELGETIGLSQAACWRRIQRLESEGYITRRVAIVDPKKIDLGVLVLVHVRLNQQGRSNLDAFAKTIRDVPNVLECFALMGSDDFFLKIAVKDVFEYERFVYETLSTIEGVHEIRSAMALSQIKNETALPV